MTRHRSLIPLAALGTLLFLGACEEPTPPVPPLSTTETTRTEAVAQPPAQENPKPPQAPIREDFEAQPRLSLFPRVGDYQPAREDERHPFWETFIDHLTRTAGLMSSRDTPPRHVWSFRSINTIDSVGFFSPLSVEPATKYTISFRMQTDLPDGASAGVGVLEFDRFLWLGEQYDEETTKAHLTEEAIVGARLKGKTRLDDLQQFDITTGPNTHMIHLVFFREGPHDRHSILLDDIAVEPLEAE